MPELITLIGDLKPMLKNVMRTIFPLAYPPKAFRDTLSAPGAIIYADIGARGDVAYPWSYMSEFGFLKVIGFEPDPEEAVRLSSQFPGRQYFPYAVWSRTEDRQFYINKQASTSSAYPPNTPSNAQYAPQFNAGRETDRVITVSCKKLDDLLPMASVWPNFIKIDTQGAEYEILRGAENMLRQGEIIVAAETWNTEVYQGAPLSFKIEELMWNYGYQVFDRKPAAAWSHKTPSGHTGKLKLIGDNILFVKRLEHIPYEYYWRTATLCYLLEIFGFRDYALAVAENSKYREAEKRRLIESMLQHEAIEVSRWHQIGAKLARKFFKAPPRYPSIT